MMDKKINEAFNEHMNREFYSGYLYLGMGGRCEELDLEGIGHWMVAQYKEELDHAKRFYDYINDRDGKVELKTIEAPPANLGTPVSMFEMSLKQEQGITQQIQQLHDLCQKQGDGASCVFLHWFLEEQVEEEKTVRQILADLKLVADSPDGLYLIDRELHKRGQEG